MNSYTFDNLISSLKNGGFDDDKKYVFDYDKIDAIKTTLQATRIVSASQMVELLNFILFRDTKLELAKIGYQYTTDPYSYGNIVGEAFSFIDDKKELNEHIRLNLR